MTIAQGVGVEVVLTFLLVWTVFSTLDPARHHTGYGVPLAIGLAVTACHLVGVSISYHIGLPQILASDWLLDCELILNTMQLVLNSTCAIKTLIRKHILLEKF